MPATGTLYLNERSPTRRAPFANAVDEVRQLREVGVGEALEESGKQIVPRAIFRVDVETGPLLVPDEGRPVRADDLRSDVVRVLRSPVGLDVRQRAAHETHRVDRGVGRVIVLVAAVAEDRGRGRHRCDLVGKKES